TKSDAEIVVSVTVTQSVVYVTTHAVTGRGKIQVSGLEPRNDPATVYGSPGKYVVVNDRTGEVTQISDKTDPGWVDDSRIQWGNKNDQ
ncbi:colicin E5-related ribonuclease, partial [Escherichia coli]|nr:colicin E5-related ribonuclease [Escherichia coli]